MANIYGIEAKKAKTFKGHEGETCYQGDLYLDGKKVGFFSDSSHCGPMEFHFDDKANSKAFDERVALYFKHNPEEEEYLQDAEIFMDKVKSLIVDEKDYKKYVKKGYDKYACQHEYPYQACAYPAQWTKEKTVADMDEKKLPVRYFSMDDFIIPVPTE